MSGPNWLKPLERLARRLGLDPDPLILERVPKAFLGEAAAYGLPVRLPHWSFGVRWQRGRGQLGATRLFEVVFPGDPCRAYLQEGNREAEDLLVAAHLLGHGDFFRHNRHFQAVRRQLGPRFVEEAADRARQVTGYLERYGYEAVERVLDAALALEPHIDPTRPLERPAGEVSFPEADLLWLLARASPVLEDWQRQLLLAVRREACYFRPLYDCQISNEGWSCYWQARLLREADFLPGDLYLEAAAVHAQVVRPLTGDDPGTLSINPYHLGFELWEQLVAQEGLESALGVRREVDDFTLVPKVLDRALADRLELFLYREVGEGLREEDPSIDNLHRAILDPRRNFGAPRVVARQIRADGTLVLGHDARHDGRGLEPASARGVLGYIQPIWGGRVVLETVDGRGEPQRLEASADP